MSSNVSSRLEMGEIATKAAARIAAELTRAIDEYEAAAHHSGVPAEPDLAGRLAALWAILSEADPELAACTARYAGP